MFDKSHIIKLTVVLYKVSGFFPANEPMKFLIREKANEILADLILLENGKDVASKIKGDVEILGAYFQVIKQQAWVKKENIAILEKEYEAIVQAINTFAAEKKPPFGRAKLSLDKTEPKQQKAVQNGIDLGKKRCGKIIEILKQRESVQVKDLKDVFPQVSKRTLRRDFEYLLEKGIVQRIGDSNNTFYQLVKG